MSMVCLFFFALYVECDFVRLSMQTPVTETHRHFVMYVDRGLKEESYIDALTFSKLKRVRIFLISINSLTQSIKLI